jgi:hypothetical protein
MLFTAMNRRQIRILLILLIVFGGAGIALRSKSGKSQRSGGQLMGQKLLGDWDVNSVGKVVIQQGSNILTIARTNDLWRVSERDDFPANFGTISSTLLKLRDLKIAQIEQLGASQLGRLDLLPAGPGLNTGTRVELLDPKGKVVKSLLLGKKHMGKSSRQSSFGEDGGFADGRYVMTDAGSGLVAVITDPLNELEPAAKSWLARDFIKIEKVRSIAVEFQDSTNSWQLTRETESGEWRLAGAAASEKLDTAKLQSFSSPLASVSVSDVAVGISEEQSGLATPKKLTAQTFDGFMYVVFAGGETNSDQYARVSVKATFQNRRTPTPDEKEEDKAKLDKEFADNMKKLEAKLAEESALAHWTYLLPAWSMESVFRKRSELLQSTTDAATPANPSLDSPGISQPQ